MPTDRLNISLTDQATICALKSLRKKLQNKTDKEEIPFATIVKALVHIGSVHTDDHVIIRYL